MNRPFTEDWAATFFRLLILLLGLGNGALTVADEQEVERPGVYFIQGVYTAGGEYCLANEITKGVYVFSNPCADQVARIRLLSVSLVGIDGTLHAEDSYLSLVRMNDFSVFDIRPKKSRPDIEGLFKPASNTTLVWYPDFARKDVTYSEKNLEDMGSGKFNITQPLALNASGILVYKGNSPFCMVEKHGQSCLALKEPFLDWGGQYSCAAVSRTSANLNFECPHKSYYCLNLCEDGKSCQLSYGSHIRPNRVGCQSGAFCNFSYVPDHFKAHCSAGACASQQWLWNQKCEYGCSYEARTIYPDLRYFQCDQTERDTMTRAIVATTAILCTAAFLVVCSLATSMSQDFNRHIKSRRFDGEYGDF
ncbi:hypothetical protein EZMO1_2899 [Endozoicomonas montiporae CL-33]|nr:hypothetical protein [Endozoicomonas montiporae]AMO56943.1 hypothetical protein EZMO1_2899 [Endozoicomonas montiporae CL-33]